MLSTAGSRIACHCHRAATNLSVLGADSDGGGEANLIYTWALSARRYGLI